MPLSICHQSLIICIIFQIVSKQQWKKYNELSSSNIQCGLFQRYVDDYPLFSTMNEHSIRTSAKRWPLAAVHLIRMKPSFVRVAASRLSSVSNLLIFTKDRLHVASPPAGWVRHCSTLCLRTGWLHNVMVSWPTSLDGAVVVIFNWLTFFPQFCVDQRLCTLGWVRDPYKNCSTKLSIAKELARIEVSHVHSAETRGYLR